METNLDQPSELTILQPDREVVQDGPANDDSVELTNPCGGLTGYGKFAHCGRTIRSNEDMLYLNMLKTNIKDRNLGSHAAIHATLFKSLLGIEREFYADRFFRILDTGQRGYILPDQLQHDLLRIATGCFCLKFRLLFDFYDADGNGLIDQDEFISILTSSVNGNDLALSSQQIQYLTRNLFLTIDKDDDGMISFSELKNFLDESPELLSSLEISIARFLKPELPRSEDSKSPRKRMGILLPYFFTPSYVKRNPCEAIWAWIYLSSVLLVYLYGFLAAWLSKRNSIDHACSLYFAAAKGFGKTLNWTSVLCLIFMLKDTNTYFRNTRLGQFLPFDSLVYAHKVNAYLMMLAICGHVCWHFVNYGCLHAMNMTTTIENYSSEGNATTTVNIQEYDHRRLVGDWMSRLSRPEIVAGWITALAAGLILSGALPCVRRSGHFEVFFYSHLIGYVTYYTTLIIHTQNHTFWMAIIIPGLVYLLEKVYHFWHMCCMSSRKIAVNKVVQWPSGVTQLTLERPANFTFSPGDYLLLRIPCLATFEWHPFTISSCPDDTSIITLHVRSAGDWTRRLHELFQTRLQNRASVPGLARHDSLHQSLKRKFTRRKQISILHQKRPSTKGQTLRKLNINVHIRGPYGTRASHIFESEHAVLICAGIGVTPFASILQSIVSRHREATSQATSDAHDMVTLGTNGLLRKVDFIWVVNNQRNLEWFIELLEELDAEQHEEERFGRFLDIQIYVTSANRISDLHAFALTSALETFYKTYKRDLITGISTRARHGRPNWDAVFNSIENNRCGKVSVFFCGPRPISRELRRHCNEHGFRFFKESF